MSLEQDNPSAYCLRVYLLGPLEVWTRIPNGTWKQVEKSVWGKGRPARSVFKCLLAAPGRRLSRSAIQDALWPDTENFELADKNVYNAVNQIRRVIGKTLMRTMETSYEIAGQSLVWVDVDACETLLREAENQGCTSLQALPLLEQVLKYLERGELLEGESGTWVYGLRKKSEDMLKQCRSWLAQAYESQGKLWQAGEQYRALCATMPPNEGALQHWIAMLQRQGKAQEAVRCFRDVKGFVEEQGFTLSFTIEQVVTSLNKQLDEVSFEPHLDRWGKTESNQAKQIDTTRRQLLETSLHIAEIAPLLPLTNFLESETLERLSQALIKSPRLDETTFQYLEICTKQFWYNRQSATLSSRVLYSPVYAHLQKMIALLEKSLLPTERTRLCSLLSQTSQLLGELSLDMGHYAHGRAFHQAALVAAREAEDNFLITVSWGRIGLANIYSKANLDALIAIQTARPLADKYATPMIQGWLAAIEAEIQAHLSQPRHCLQALEHASNLDKQPTSPLEDYLVRFDNSLLKGYYGVCFRVLSHPINDQSAIFLQKAQDTLREAIISLDPLFLQRKPRLLTDLAVVTMYQKDIEETCTLVSQAAMLATQMHLHKIIERLVALREPLSEWKENASVKTLDAHLALLSSLEHKQH